MKSPEKLWQGLITTSQNQDDVSWLHPPLWPPWRRWLWELLSRFSPSFLLPWKRSPSWHNPGGLATKVFRLKISEYFVTHIRPVDALRTLFFFFSLSLFGKEEAGSERRVSRRTLTAVERCRWKKRALPRAAVKERVGRKLFFKWVVSYANGAMKRRFFGG